MSTLTGLRQSWQEAVAPLRQRWLLLPPREQVALAVAGATAALLFLVFGLWRPSHEAAQKAEARYAAARVLLELQRQAGPVGAPGTGGGSVLRTVSDAAASRQLLLSRMEPEGEARVRVWLDKADFNAVAAWLAALAGQGIRVDEGQVERLPEGGVSARLVLAR